MHAIDIFTTWYTGRFSFTEHIMKDTIGALIQSALKTLATQDIIPDASIPASIKIDRTKDPKHGDFASNIAMMLAKPAKTNPRALAEAIINAVPASDDITKIDIAGPGFINFTLAKDAHTQIIKDILAAKETFGQSNVGNNHPIHMEYVSANPTGPLHVGHGRSAAYGSCVVNLLRATGFKVHSEYYVNDAGRQMDILATSVWLRYLALHDVTLTFPSNGYKGDYVIDIAKSVDNSSGNTLVRDANKVMNNVPDDAPDGDKEAHIDALISNAKTLLADDYKIVFNAALDTILTDIKEDLAEFGVIYDEWFLEKRLFEQGMIDKYLDILTKSDYLYEKEGAIWFKSTEFGDDKDRVVKRSNGQTTYFASDIAYHLSKLDRGYHTIIDVFGADHHGYIQRLKAGMSAIAKREDALVTKIIQFVSLFRGKEKVAMSTRGGEFITLRELRDEVGNDATRFFYIFRKVEQPLDFDLELAKSQSNDNPIYYIQYAYARICSVWRQLAASGQAFDENNGLEALALLDSPTEIALCKKLQAYTETLEKSAINYEPHLLAHYLYDLANAYHSYYTSSKFLVDDNDIRNAKLCLNKSTQYALANGLALLGLTAPESM